MQMNSQRLDALIGFLGDTANCACLQQASTVEFPLRQCVFDSSVAKAVLS